VVVSSMQLGPMTGDGDRIQNGWDAEQRHHRCDTQPHLAIFISYTHASPEALSCERQNPDATVTSLRDNE
jgi:hypothetical protein